MTAKNVAWKLLAATCVFAGIQTTSHAVDSTSFEFGSGNRTKMVRLGAQWKWDSQWWKSNGTHIGGYWDLTISQWRGNHFQNAPGRTQNITAIGITPVFRFQNDSLKGFYTEAGIGANLLSELYDNDGHKLSTTFQFSDHLGIGYVFANNLDLGVKIQHFSNGGIKKPNQGVNFAFVRVSYPF
ncbi:MAG: acyloxyacyl hydrolase [Noviherbaspirillum sp.]